MEQFSALCDMWLIVPILLALHVIVCLLLVLVVLMQLPRSEGLGAAFGGTLVYDGEQLADTVVDGNLITARHPGVTDAFLDVFLADAPARPGAGNALDVNAELARISAH